MEQITDPTVIVACAGALGDVGLRTPDVCPRCGATEDGVCGDQAAHDQQIADIKAGKIEAEYRR
jgi:hypothetical protein